MAFDIKIFYNFFRLHVCHHLARTEVPVWRTTSITRLTAAAKQVLLENFAKKVIDVLNTNSDRPLPSAEKLNNFKTVQVRTTRLSGFS